MKQKNILLASAITLLLAFAFASWLYSRHQNQQAEQAAEANRAVLLRAHSPTLGKVDAPVTIVEFIDPACETCRAFYPMVKQLMASHPDQIRLVLRYAPFHEGSDKVVAMLEAANRQGKFWPALETLLEHQSAWVSQHKPDATLAWKQLDGLGLNMEQLAFDISSPALQQVVAQDLADAKALKVTMTPEYFVNGKPLPSFGFDQLQELVNQALGKVH